MRATIRALPMVGAGLVTLAGAVYGLAVLTGTAWQWWLQPVMLGLGSVQLWRQHFRGERRLPLSPSGLRIHEDAGAPLWAVGTTLGFGVAVWSALTQGIVPGALAACLTVAGRVFEGRDHSG